MVDDEPEIRAIFCEALEHLTAADEARYLEEACQGKPDLRARGEGLLKALRQAGSFFQTEQPRV